MPRKLVHDDGVLGLVERSGDVLHEQTQRFLVFLCCHWTLCGLSQNLAKVAPALDDRLERMN